MLSLMKNSSASSGHEGSQGYLHRLLHITSSDMSIFLAFLLIVLFTIETFKISFRSKLNGTKGPTPLPILGNILAFRKGNILEVLVSWQRQYGKVFRYMEGLKSVTVVSDPWLIEEILSTKFDDFINRRRLPFTSKHNILHTEGEEWKRLRKICSPTFSVYSMKKEVYPFVSQAARFTCVTMETDAERNDGLTNVYEHLQWFALSSIEQRIIGIPTKDIFVEKKEILAECRALMKAVESDFVVKLAVVYPKLTPILEFLRNHWPWKLRTKLHRERICEIISQRVDDEQLHLHKDSSKQTGESLVKRLLRSGKYNKQQVVDHVFIFLVAAFETTSSCLSFTLYLLSRHQKVQQRLYEELNNNICQSVDELNKLKYLDAVLNESLRLYPVGAMFVNRRPAHDISYVHSNGSVDFHANELVQVNVPALHMDTEYWEEPEKFKPERFLAEAKGEGVEGVGEGVKATAYRHIPFGAGRRRCIGEKLAQMEMKEMLSQLLIRNRVYLHPNYEAPPETVCEGSIHPRNGVFLCFESRHC